MTPTCAISAGISDVRCGPLQAPDRAATANAAGGATTPASSRPTRLRVTDKFNGVDRGRWRAMPATVVDFPFPVTVPCSGTAG